MCSHTEPNTILLYMNVALNPDVGRQAVISLGFGSQLRSFLVFETPLICQSLHRVNKLGVIF